MQIQFKVQPLWSGRQAHLDRAPTSVRPSLFTEKQTNKTTLYLMLQVSNPLLTSSQSSVLNILSLSIPSGPSESLTGDGQNVVRTVRGLLSEFSPAGFGLVWSLCEGELLSFFSLRLNHIVSVRFNYSLCDSSVFITSCLYEVTTGAKVAFYVQATSKINNTMKTNILPLLSGIIIRCRVYLR